MKPRVLYIDIETAPMRGWFWDLFETNPLEVEDHWYLLSFAYKWNEGRVKVLALPDFRSRRQGRWDDKTLVKAAWKLIDEADLVIGHNGDNFDLKKLATRFVYHGLPPPSPYKTVDTLKLAKKHFKFDSNRLDFIGHYLGVGRKLPHTGKHLWFGCMRNEAKSWATMKKYNAQDVVLLEKVYKRLRPYATTHPDLTLYDGTTGCRTCRSPNIVKRGHQLVKSKIRQMWHCKDCTARFPGELYEG